MKKIFLMMAAVAALSFTSCGNKAAQTEAPADETEVVDLENATAALAEQLEAGDVNKFQEALEAAKQKVTELLTNNPEVAKEYLDKVQTFLKENADKVKAVVGDNAVVQTAVAALTDTPAENIINGLKSQLDATGEAGQAVVDNAVEQVNATGEELKQAIQDKAGELKQAANDKVEEGKKAANDKVNEAANKVNEKVNEAASHAAKKLGL